MSEPLGTRESGDERCAWLLGGAQTLLDGGRLVVERPAPDEDLVRGLWALVQALDRGDLEAAREVAARGRGYEGEEEASLPILAAFLGDPPDGYADAAREAAGSILIGGRLAHDEVADVMPAADAFAMTSGVIDIALKKTSAPLAASSVSWASTLVSVAS